MKNSISKNHLILALACLFALCIVLALSLTFAPVVTYADQVSSTDSPVAFKETPAETIKYDALERTNYVNTSKCRVVGESSTVYPGVATTYPGIIGNNAICKTKDDPNINAAYQLYFENCFERGKTYEISFYAKTIGASPSFYVEVRYQNENATINEAVPQRLTSTNGEWTKYSFRFESNKELHSMFKLTLSFKNWCAKNSDGVITEYYIDRVYYDQFSAVLVDDGYNPYISGEKFSAEDWSTTVAEQDIVSFSGESYPAGVKTTTGELTSKIFEVPESNLFRLRFAIQRTSGTNVNLSVKGALGEDIDQVALTSNSSLSYFDFVTSDLSDHSFVYLQFDITCENASDYAIIGAIEMVSHKHDTTVQPMEYPKYDFPNCGTTKFCNSCQLDLVFVEHNFLTTREPTCGSAGEMVCQNQQCGKRIVLSETGDHQSYVRSGTSEPIDITCSASNDRVIVVCAECGGGARYLSKSHNMQCVSISNTEHQSFCTNCSYVDSAEKHSTNDIVIAKNPSVTESGFAVVNCEICNQKHSIDLPNLADEDAWTKTVITQETCTEIGRVKYSLNAQPTIFTEYDVEALGHSYQAIKQIPTCTEDGISLHHKCTECEYVRETSAEIKVLTAYGHDLGDWIIEKQPTLDYDGMRRIYCTRCDEIVEEQVIPKLDEVNYTKYALDDHDEAKGFYYYYSSNEWGTYSVFVEGKKQDDITIIAICVSCAVVIVGAVTACCIIATKAKRKKVK